MITLSHALSTHFAARKDKKKPNQSSPASCSSNPELPEPDPLLQAAGRHLRTLMTQLEMQIGSITPEIMKLLEVCITLGASDKFVKEKLEEGCQLSYDKRTSESARTLFNSLWDHKRDLYNTIALLNRQSHADVFERFKQEHYPALREEANSHYQKFITALKTDIEERYDKICQKACLRPAGGAILPDGTLSPLELACLSPIALEHLLDTLLEQGIRVKLDEKKASAVFPKPLALSRLKKLQPVLPKTDFENLSHNGFWLKDQAGLLTPMTEAEIQAFEKQEAKPKSS